MTGAERFARWALGLELAAIPEDVREVRVGDPVAFIPFSEFGILGR